VKNYMQGAASIANAVARYVREVKADEFPGAGHDF
jgi:ketopantoate hydroxymethyltransferase